MGSETDAVIDGVSAILLISRDAAQLREFYGSALGLPLQEERHEGVPLHYGCDLGGVHFAIHPSEGWPGRPVGDALSPVVCLRTTDAAAVARRLGAKGWKCSGPHDHGFALVVSFRDPDGNAIEVLQLSPQ
ncbi:MAG TPA: VOC family protein [Rhizomicrobium sp.]|nr:VOC family protein [Rhizomicrobium sp.]